MPKLDSICVISNDHDVELLSLGRPVPCSGHKHISLREAQLMVSGTRQRPFLDPDWDPRGRLDQPVSESYRPTGCWARVPHADCEGAGCSHCDRGYVQSTKCMVILTARDWQVINGAMQFAPIGSARPPRKHSRTHLRRPSPRKFGPVRSIFTRAAKVSAAG